MSSYEQKKSIKKNPISDKDHVSNKKNSLRFIDTGLLGRKGHVKAKKASQESEEKQQKTKQNKKSINNEFIQKPTVAILGAGVGGLSTALLLASNGYKVDVYEKNKYIGGKATEINTKGFRFDIGPSLITMPFVWEKLFKLSHLDLKDYLKFKKLKVNTRYFFPDKKVVDFYSDVEKLNEEIKSKLLITPEQLGRYYLYTEKIYNIASRNFIYSPVKISNLFKYKNLSRILDLDFMRKMFKANSFFFKDNHYMQKILNRYATYSGSSPYLAPATLNLIFYIENIFGCFYLKQGISSLPFVLEELCKKNGVNFYLSHEVKKLNKSNKSIESLEFIDLKSKKTSTKKYKYVVSNLDIDFFNKNILKRRVGGKDLIRSALVKPSSSALIYLWGVKGKYRELDIHNIFFSKNYKEEFADIFKHKKLPEDPTIYVNISSKYNSMDAKKGHENWFVMINVPHLYEKKNQIDWRTMAKSYKKVVLSKLISSLGLDINKKIVFEKIITPLDIQRDTNSSLGSIYGQSSNGLFADILRYPNKDSSINGLYHVGGTVHPGGGLPMVTLSAINVFEEIEKDLRKNSKDSPVQK